MNKLCFLILLLSCYACSSKPADIAQNSSPNVLLIMTDDQGWGDFGVNGNDSIHTPNLDRLAQNSISFDRFFVSPVCAPTRASLLTGRYHLRTGTSWVTHRKEVMRAEEVTIAEALKAEGYRTGIFGKWHNGAQYPNDPLGQGFDEFLGFTAGHWNNYHDPILFHQEEKVRKKGYINDIFTEAAIDWMLKEKETPFFCYLPYNTPHSPFQVPAPYFEKYKAMGLSDKNASVHGMCENIDDNIAKLLQKLEENKMLDNTIIIFLTDNGPNGARYNGGMRGTKASVHEGGMRVPLFIKWGDRLEAGKVIKPISTHMDIFPTILDLCDVKLDKKIKLDGKSLVPLLEEKTGDWPDRQIYHIQNSGNGTFYNSALRNEQHRFVLNQDNSMLLFDMQKDPGQTSNIIDQYPDLKEKYFQDIQAWYQEVSSQGIQPPPIPIGHRAHGTSTLPAPEAKLQGTIQFQGKMGWANDYLVNWSSTKDLISWDLEVAQEDEYEIAIEYVCKAEQVGSNIEVLIGEQSLTKRIDEAYYPDFYSSPDYVKRGEVYERDWKTLKLGRVRLAKGAVSLKISAQSIAATEVMELKSVFISH